MMRSLWRGSTSANTWTPRPAATSWWSSRRSISPPLSSPAASMPTAAATCAAASVGLRRVEEGQEPEEGELPLVGDADVVAAGQVPLGDAEDAVAGVAELPVALLEVGVELADRDRAVRSERVAADGEDRGERPLGKEQAAVRTVHQHAEPLAAEVERHLVERAPARVGVAAFQDGGVDRVVEAGLQPGDQRGALGDQPALAAGQVEGGVEPHRTLGEGAGLVGAQHVHGAEVLDGVEAADDHAPAGHAPRAG